MKQIHYYFNDFDELKKRLGYRLTDETIKDICNYLEKHNQFLDITDCYDPQSGWKGADIYLDSINLSKNGYCLNEEYVKQILEQFNKL